MSRIGRLPVAVPNGVQVNVQGSDVHVKGPKGELMQQVDPDLQIEQEDGQILIKRPTDQKRHRSVHGLYRALIANMVTGVSAGFVKELELVGFIWPFGQYVSQHRKKITH